MVTSGPCRVVSPYEQREFAFVGRLFAFSKRTSCPVASACTLSAFPTGVSIIKTGAPALLNPLPRSGRISVLRSDSSASSIFSIVVGGLAVARWIFDIPLLKNVASVVWSGAPRRGFVPAPGPRARRTRRHPNWAHATGARRILGGRGLLALLTSMLYLSGGLAAEPRVLVLNDVNEPPYTNAERTGFLDIIATEAFRRAGLELRLVKLPAQRALLLANDGIEDGDLTRIAGLEAQFPNLIRVPEKLVDWDFAAFSKDASIPASVEAIRGRSVGLIRGWKIYEQAMAGAEGVITVDDSEQLFRLLELDRIKVVLYVRAMGLVHIGKYGDKDVRVLEPSLYKREMYIYLHRRHAGHAPKIASALRAMKRDGTYQRAYNEKLLPYIGGSPR